MFVRQRDLDDPVEPSRAKQRPVENIDPVCCPDNLHIPAVLETVHSRKQLHQRPLHFPVAGCIRFGAGSTDCIDLINKDNCRGFLLCEFEELADETGSFANILLDQFRSHYPHEMSVCFMCDGFCKQGLSCTRRTVEQHTFRRLYTNPCKEIRTFQRQLDRFTDLVDLVLKSTDIRIGLLRSIDKFHAVNLCIDTAR